MSGAVRLNVAVGTLAVQASEHAHVRSGHATAISARKMNKGQQLSAACPALQTCEGSITRLKHEKIKGVLVPLLCV